MQGLTPMCDLAEFVGAAIALNLLLVNGPLTTVVASTVAGLIIALNGFLLFQTFA